MHIILVKFWYYILDNRKIKSQVKLFYITHYISAYKPIIMFHKSNIITKMIVYEWIKVATGRFRSSSAMPAWLHQVAICHFKVWFCITYHSIIYNMRFILVLSAIIIACNMVNAFTGIKTSNIMRIRRSGPIQAVSEVNSGMCLLLLAIFNTFSTAQYELILYSSFTYQSSNLFDARAHTLILSIQYLLCLYYFIRYSWISRSGIEICRTIIGGGRLLNYLVWSL